MISNLDAGIFIVTLIVISIFIIGSIKKGNMDLLNKVYIFISIAFICWILPLLMMKFVSVDNIKMLYVLDSLTYIGVCFAPLGYLCLAIVFVKGFEKMPKWIWLLFVFPIIINLVVWTNPWHHLQYQVFSVIKSEIVFGPFLYVSGAYNYLCLVGGIFLMISFAVKNATTLYLKQCLLVAFGGLIPLFVNSLATFTTLNMSITATPISFIPTIVFNGIAIYQLHILDIKPIITRHILDRIADCYVVLNEDGLVMNYNNPFDDIFASRYGIKENGYLKDCVKNEDISLKTPLYNILTSVDACRQSGSIISYEQAVTINVDGNARKNYYITDVSPLFIQGKIAGFVVTFKDISQLKKSMEQLQDSQRRMMEQERLAFLGQMMGGLAHNLKTPIMSISGCISASGALLDECLSSIDDPQVVADDYREIYGEMESWFEKIKESCSYMSDIITAIKGQAANTGLSQESSFTLDELIKRSRLLMRHELLRGGCNLVTEYDSRQNIVIRGDINNLIQVINNLLSNAIDAQKMSGGGDIIIGVNKDQDHVKIYVKDTGPGVSESVKKKLFKEMTTSKGTMGTGLGLYISNIVVSGKFGGSLYLEDNPGGGSVFCISLPLEMVDIVDSSGNAILTQVGDII